MKLPVEYKEVNCRLIWTTVHGECIARKMAQEVLNLIADSQDLRVLTKLSSFYLDDVDLDQIGPYNERETCRVLVNYLNLMIDEYEYLTENGLTVDDLNQLAGDNTMDQRIEFQRDLKLSNLSAAQGSQEIEDASLSNAFDDAEEASSSNAFGNTEEYAHPSNISEEVKDDVGFSNASDDLEEKARLSDVSDDDSEFELLDPDVQIIDGEIMLVHPDNKDEEVDNRRNMTM